MNAFVDTHRASFGVEPICKVLKIAPSGYRRHAAQQRDPALRCARVRRDESLIPHIKRVWQVNLQVYGATKVWRQMNREGVQSPADTVERLMRRLGCVVSFGAGDAHHDPRCQDTVPLGSGPTASVFSAVFDNRDSF